MVRTFALSRMAWALGTALALLVSVAEPSPAQDAPKPRVRALLKDAIDSSKRGDYDLAAKLYAAADAGKAELTATERTDLAKLIQQNDAAIQGRHEGGLQIQMSLKYLEQGNAAEASKLLRSAAANPYLTVADREAIKILNERVHKVGAGAATAAKAMSEPVNKDMKWLLGAARAALSRGELDMAESFCAQADKVGYTIPTIFHPWSDTPSKVRRDIQTARAKLTPPPPVDVAEKKESGSPLGFMKGIFGSKKDEKPAGPDGAPLAKGAAKPGPDMLPAHHSSSSATPTDPARPDLIPKMDVHPAAMGGAAAKTRAVQLINEGYAAMDRGDLALAQKYAVEAKALRPDLAWWERNPDRLLSDIERRATSAAAPPPATKGTAADARAMVKDGRALLSQAKIEEAEKLMRAAAGISGVRWGLFEDNPDKLRKDIQTARGKRDKEEAAQLLTEARTLYQAGNYHEARLKALHAQKLHGSYSIWDLGDRPQKLLEEIQRAEKSKGTPLDPIKDGSSGLKPIDHKVIAKKEGPKIGKDKPGVPASVASIERQKAVMLLVEARDLQRKGYIVQAREKALESKALGVPFVDGEDSPDAALWSLNVLCDANVQAYLKRATDTVLNHAADGERFKRAQADIELARQLALAFRHDLAPIDQKTLWLQQAALAAGASPVTPLPKTGHEATDAMAKAGRDLLDKARLEIRSGNTLISRKLAEQAYHPRYGIQEEALAVIRSIDAEEGNQLRLGAERNARAGVDAFMRKDYRMASSILSAIDWKLLTPETHARLRGIMAAPEMALVDVPGPGPRDKDVIPAKGSATDVEPTPVPGDTFRAMEKIQFQQLRERTLVTLSNAHDLVTRGFHDKAIDLLSEHAHQLKTASLEPELLTPLKRQVDFRLQQYRTLQAQLKIEGVHKTVVNPETIRNAGIAKTQQEAMEKIKLGNQLLNEGKTKEAMVLFAQAKALDRDNIAAAMGEQIADTRMRLDEWNTNKKENEESFLRATINKWGPFADSDRPLITGDKETIDRRNKRRAGGLAAYNKTPFQKMFEEKLSHPVHLKFNNTPLEKVLETLSAQAGGVTIVPDRNALLEDSISLDQQMTTPSLENISLKSALNLLLDQAKLTYVVKEDYILVTTGRHAENKKMTRVVHSVADLVVPVENHPLHPVNNFQDAMMRHIAASSGIMFQAPTPYMPPHGLAPGAPVSSQSSGLGSMSFASAGGVTPPNLTPAKSANGTIEALLMDLIQKSVAQDTWRDMGGPGSIQYYPLGMALIINQSQEVQEEVLQLLEALRRLQDLEVAIEMKLVNVSEAFFERLGLDFDVNIRTGTSRREPDLLNGQFTPFGFVNRDLDRLQIISGLTPAGTLTPDLNIPLRGSSFDFSVPPFGGFPGTLGADGGLSLGLAFLSDIQVFMFMEAAQGDRRTQVMQAPKITVFNGQTASISVNDQQFFLTNVTLNTAGAQTFFSPQNQPFPLGVNLQVTPVISADRRFVRLNLTPSLTNLASATVPLIPVQIPVPQLLEGPGTGTTTTGQPVIFQMFFQQPNFATIFVNTTVNVPDGGTVLLGGLKTMSEARNEFGPPILSKIPYLNRLFKNVGYGREVSSLMIMVTPRIIINEEEEAIFLGRLEPIPRE